MKRILSVAIIASLVGCANTGAGYRPMVDSRPGQNYEQDLGQCQQYAAKVAGAAETAAVGAVIGALFGAALSIVGDNRSGRSANAGIGALTGAVGGGVQGETDQRNIIRRCLSGRGYAVLN